MKKIVVLGAVIALGLACGGEWESDGAVMIIPGGAAPDCGPGNTVAFAAGDIYYCDAYGKKVTRVTNTREIREDNPCWSPDGEYLAYEAYDPQTQTGGIFVVPKEGGAPVPLTQDRGHYPAWSPDGQIIAYGKYSDGEYGIWTVAARGGEPERLTPKGNFGSPCWAPEGRRLYYAGHDPKDPKGPCFLWCVNVETRRTVRLWSYQEPFYDLAVCPDGEWLAVIFSGFYGSDDVWLIEVRTGRRYRVTNEPEPDFDGD